MPINEFDQPVGDDVPGWSPRELPSIKRLEGRSVTLVPLTPDHADDLLATTAAPGMESRWTYMFGGPFPDRASFATHLDGLINRRDGQSLAIVPNGGDTPHGNASLMRADPEAGVIEVGSIMFGPALAGTRASTEAIYLLARHVFDELGYRRFEWKCDSINERSRRAAERFGFAYEGTFRQHMIYKGRSRDTAWFSILDHEWPAIKAAYETWLAESNFDADGRQRSRLRAAPR